MTYTYNRKGITRKVLSEIVRGLPPLRQPKDSGNAKMLVACLRVVSLRCQFFSDIFTKQPHPLPA